jgi:copper chaperone CopZ
MIMKKLVLSLIIASAVISCNNNKSGAVSAVKEYTVHVWGNCEKCEANIEKACQIKGVSTADWIVESKLLTVKLDTAVVSLNSVIDEVTKAGYDTETKMADDYAYGSLPQCCQYERRNDSK